MKIGVLIATAVQTVMWVGGERKCSASTDFVHGKICCR